MKLEVLKNDVKTTDEFESTKFSVDKESMHLIFRSFIQYSDPIGSIVREITSNCFDSHIEAGIKAPVYINMTREDKIRGIPYSISFIDSGMGLSKERIKETYSKFGSSTKRDSNEQIGAFGFGAKSPLGYTDMFEVITVYDKIKYHYVVHMGEIAPVIDLIESNSTDEKNGTEIKILIKDSHDYSSFKRSLVTQLSYFDNIIYNDECGIDNNFKIYEGKHFKYNIKSSPDNELHICLGNVYYPINYLALGINSYTHRIPVGLKFNIGELKPVWNREDIEYNNSNKNKILKKIDLLKEELRELHNNKYKNVNTLEEYYRLKDLSNDNLLYITNDISINVGNFINLDVKCNKYKTFDRIPDIWDNFQVRSFVTNGKMSNKKYYTSIKNLVRDKKVLFYSDSPTAVSNQKNKFISDTISKDFYIIKNRSSSSILDNITYYAYYNNLNITKFEDLSDEQKELILEFKREQEELQSKFYRNLNDIVITDEWKKEQKELRKKDNIIKNVRNLNISIPSRCVSFSSTWDNKVIVDFKVSDLVFNNVKKNSLIIYGFQEDDKKLQLIAKIFKICRDFDSSNSYYKLNDNKIRIIKIAKNNEKLVNNLNSLHVSKYMKKESNLLNKIFTAIYIKEHFDINLFERLNNKLINDVLPNLYTRLLNIKHVYHNYRIEMLSKSDIEQAISEFTFDYDLNMLKDVEIVNETVKFYPLLKFINFNNFLDTDELIKELNFYIDKKGRINPDLIRRFNLKKNKVETIIKSRKNAQNLCFKI